jgi:hypothetical protein
MVSCSADKARDSLRGSTPWCLAISAHVFLPGVSVSPLAYKATDIATEFFTLAATSTILSLVMTAPFLSRKQTQNWSLFYDVFLR